MQEATLSSFQASTHILFGPGAVGMTGDIVSQLGIAQVLLVTDAGVLRAGAAGHAVNALGRADIASAVFDAVESNPGIDTVQKAAALYAARGCAGIVAVGGGSVIDVAKAAGVLAANPGDLRAYFGVGKISNSLPPLVAIPTTVGAGSEVTNFAVVTDRAERRKELIGGQLMAPDFALLDPGLALTLPHDVLLGTALGALANAVESVTSVFASPFSDGPALQAVRLIAANLADALASPAPKPRANLLYASTLAGLALTSARLGLAHAMAHALAAHHDVPVGLAAGLLLPPVMAFNLPAAQDALDQVASALGVEGGAAAVPDAIRRLAARAGAPAQLTELGASDLYVAQMAQDVAGTGGARVVNPRRVTPDDIAGLYRALF